MPPRLMDLWLRTRICQEFPAYKLGELRDSPDGKDLMRAMQLLGIAREAEAAKRG